MSVIVSGLFDNSKHAGMAISELKEKDLEEDVSIIAKDEESGEISTHSADSGPLHGAKGGAISGAAVGGLGALALGASAFTIPGLGLLVAGPIATALAGMTGGAITGGIVGALVDQGFSEDKAKSFETEIKKGQVFASVETDEDEAKEVTSIFKKHGAKSIDTMEK